MRRTVFLLLALATTACAGGGRAPVEPTPSAGTREGAMTTGAAVTTSTSANPSVLEAAARADSLRESFNQADVDFITGMIGHHAQALVMARMAEPNGASSQIRTLAGRIINAQNDEITLMQNWLRERGQAVPDPEHAMHDGHHAHMPGMLTPDQLARLERAQGPEFDRLFLQFMIQHHQGAIVMVQELFDTYGAAQGDAIFKMASDMAVDQETEIDRMRLMLREIVFETEAGL